MDVNFLVIGGTFLFGLTIGSFINAAEYRLARHLPLAQEQGGGSARSQCPHCHHTLSARELIPVLSFVILRAKCRSCRKPISWQYPVVELLTAAAFAVVAQTTGWHWQLVPLLLFTAVLIFIFVYDLKHQIILDLVTLPAIILAVIFSLAVGKSLVSLLTGAMLAGGFFALQYLISRGKWIGAGDIRLGVLMGALLGWPSAVGALVLAYTIGAVVAVFLLITKKAQWQSQIPLGVFLTPTTYIFLLYGPQILAQYQKWLYHF